MSSNNNHNTKEFTVNNANNNEQNKNIITNNKNIVSSPDIYDDDKDENLIKSLEILKNYTQAVVLKYCSLTADINNINLTLIKILEELNKTDKQEE